MDPRVLATAGRDETQRIALAVLCMSKLSREIDVIWAEGKLVIRATDAPNRQADMICEIPAGFFTRYECPPPASAAVTGSQSSTSAHRGAGTAGGGAWGGDSSQQQQAGGGHPTSSSSSLSQLAGGGRGAGANRVSYAMRVDSKKLAGAFRGHRTARECAIYSASVPLVGGGGDASGGGGGRTSVGAGVATAYSHGLLVRLELDAPAYTRTTNLRYASLADTRLARRGDSCASALVSLPALVRALGSGSAVGPAASLLLADAVPEDLAEYLDAADALTCSAPLLQVQSCADGPEGASGGEPSGGAGGGGLGNTTGSMGRVVVVVPLQGGPGGEVLRMRAPTSVLPGEPEGALGPAFERCASVSGLPFLRALLSLLSRMGAARSGATDAVDVVLPPPGGRNVWLGNFSEHMQDEREGRGARAGRVGFLAAVAMAAHEFPAPAAAGSAMLARSEKIAVADKRRTEAADLAAAAAGGGAGAARGARAHAGGVGDDEGEER